MSKINLNIFKQLFLEKQLSYTEISKILNIPRSTLKSFAHKLGFKSNFLRKCLHCGKEFFAKRADGKFCCHKCQQAYNNEINTLKRALNKQGIYTCQYCGKQFEYTAEKPFLFGKNKKDKFLAWKFCCYECARAHTTKKNKQTCMKKYGTDCTLKDPKINTKCRKTWDTKYGKGKVPLQNEKIKTKVRKTNLKRYGHENVFQLEEVKEKAKQTRLERYGANYTLQSPELKQKVEQTNIEKYGYKNPMQNIKVQQKASETTFRKYGVNCIFQLDNIKEKAKISRRNTQHSTTSKEELFILYLLRILYPNTYHQYNTSLYPFNCDFYIPIFNLYIEYQGFWHHGIEPFNKNDIYHQTIIENWKLRKDKNPQFEKAINVWTYRDPLKRQIAKENNLNWLEFFTMDEFMNWYKKQSGIPLLEYKSSKE